MPESGGRSPSGPGQVRGFNTGVFDIASRHRHALCWRTLVTLLAVVGMLGTSPLIAIAQEGTPVGATEAAIEVPTEAPTAVPTEIPTETPTQVPTEVPTQIATETATAVATELPAARGASMASMESTDDAPEIPPNTDSLAAGATDPVTLDPGQQATFAFTYHVTTPRTGTAIRAELRHTDGTIASGWGLSAQAGGSAWADGSGAVDVTEQGTLGPDSAFPLSITVTAPADVTAEQTVSLGISSTASTERGETETGVVETTSLASLTVVPPPIPNTDSLMATSSTEPVTLDPGGTQQYTFSYNVTTPRTGTSIIADLRLPDGSPATGWTIAAQAGGGEAATGEASVTVGESATLTPDTAFALTITITVTAPVEVAAEQTVSLFVSSTATTAGDDVEIGIAGDAPVSSVTVAPPPPSMDQRADGAQGTVVLAAVAGQYDIAVQDQAGNPLTGACYTVAFQTSLDLGLVGTVLNLLGLTTVVENLVNGLENRTPIDSCGGGSETPTGVVSGLVTSLSNLTLGLGLTLDGLLQAITITPQITPTVHPSGYDSPPAIGGVTSFTLYTFHYSGVESTITYTALPPCGPTASAGSIDFGTSHWDGIAYPPVTGDLAITVTATGESCAGLPAGWSVRVQPSALTGDGGTIPATDMDFIGFVGDPIPQYLTAIPRSSFDSSQFVSIATTEESSTFPADGVTWQAQFSLDPPDDLPPGGYTGDILIDTNNGL